MAERNELHVHRTGNRRQISILQRNGLFGEWCEVNVAFSQVKSLTKVLLKIVASRDKKAYKIGKTLEEKEY